LPIDSTFLYSAILGLNCYAVLAEQYQLSLGSLKPSFALTTRPF
jgi:hypothetical protein